MTGIPENLKHIVAAHAPMMKALTRARNSLAAAIRANVDGDMSFDPSEHVVIKQIDAALLLATMKPGE